MWGFDPIVRAGCLTLSPPCKDRQRAWRVRAGPGVPSTNPFLSLTNPLLTGAERRLTSPSVAVLSDLTAKPERALSPGSMSEEERRKLIARQRSALYGEGPYVDETGTPHPGVASGPPNGPASLRGHSPLAYEFGRTPPVFPQGGPQPPVDAAVAGDPTRTNSTSSPQPNVASQQQQASPPTGSPSLGAGASSKPGQGPAVAPIGTRPAQPTVQRSTPPVTSSLNQGFGTSDNDSAGGQSNPSSAAAEGRNGGLWGGRNNSVWGNNGSSGQQASVWGAA